MHVEHILEYLAHYWHSIIFLKNEIMVVVQLLSCIWLFMTPWTAAHQASLSFTFTQSLLKLMSIESVMHPTISPSFVPLSSCPQSLPASGSFPMSRLFTAGGQSIAASAFSFQWISGLISFRIDWFDLLAVLSLVQELSRVLPSTTILKHQFSSTQPSLWSSSHIHTRLQEKP